MFYVFCIGTCSGMPHYYVVLRNAAGIERKVSKWMMKILIIMSHLIGSCIVVSSTFVHFHGVV